MLGLHMFKTDRGKERVEIYYSEMSPPIRQIVSIVREQKPVLYGSDGEEKILLEPGEIYYFDTVDRRTFAYGREQVWQVSKTLSLLEEELRPYGFVRINKSNLVNVFQIKRIRPEPNMRVSAILKNEEKLQVNRSYKRAFEDYLNEIRKGI